MIIIGNYIPNFTNKKRKKMNQEMKLFQCVVWLKPKYNKENEVTREAKIISDVKTVLATNEQSVERKAIKDLPKEYDSMLDDVIVAIRPF